ncbi:hypothetical protein BN946_scf184753.g3 [Trametes cinnabarina]|uniref:Uncharacterized protein n=1 Tax=Pycnoporus cinnabarinus TaxID=5643 RepID=A0A060SXK7_PYCCI|nr:hypothetical protein BN946_scf184753.g3 [Trametes cinnabarina]
MPENQRIWCQCAAVCARRPGGGDLVALRTWYDHRRHRIQVQSLAEFLQGSSSDVPPAHSVRRDDEQFQPRAHKRRRQNQPSEEDYDDVPPLQPDPIVQDASMLSRQASPSPGLSHTRAGRDEVSGEVNEQLPDNVSAEPIQSAQPTEADEVFPEVTRKDMKNTLKYIELLRSATLGESGLDEEVLEQLQNPLCEELKLTNPDVTLAIEVYMASGNGSRETYNAVRDAIMRRFPDVKLLTHYKVKRTIEQLTGIVPLVHDMCINSCMAFTGPRELLTACPKCGQARYCPIRSEDTQTGRQQFSTILPGPQIQALYRSADTARDMTYLYDKCAEIIQRLQEGAGIAQYGDFPSGSLLLDAVARGIITKQDVVLLFSCDGAQLYRNKQSDCWIYVWVIANLGPDKRYKKKFILMGGVIPGPKPPDDLDSFFFPGFYHVSALMREGLHVWNAALESQALSRIFVAMGMADGPAMAGTQGTVGHHGARGCRIYCGLVGRHKPGCPHYYPALLKPVGVLPAGCDHGDVLLSSIGLPSSAEYNENLKLVISAESETQFRQLRRATGICKPSIFAGLSRIFPLPLGFPIDLMHLTGLNLPDLFMGLFRGVIKGSTQSDPKTWPCAVLQGPVWVEHGRRVERAMNFLPGFHNRPPRNIAEKISSGYKATEFQTYMYKYAPFMLRTVLGRPYWENLCKVARAVVILHQQDISQDELVESKQLLDGAVLEFEELYYARDPDRLHVVRPAIHNLWHTPDEIVRRGTLIGCTQYLIERVIGELGADIKQPSNPYANLSQRALRRCQFNSLKVMLPHLDRSHKESDLPRGALALGDGYALLRALDSCARTIPAIEMTAFARFLQTHPDLAIPQEQRNATFKIRKWARLRTPRQQVARSAWKECLKPLFKLRMARCVRFVEDGKTEVGEVRYFCQLGGEGQRWAVALVSVFDHPDLTLYEESFKTVELRTYQGDAALRVINVKTIKNVVGMVPEETPPEGDYMTDHKHLHVGSSYVVVEKMGFMLDVMTGLQDPEMDIDE